MPMVRSSKLPVKHPGLIFKEKSLSTDDITEVATKLRMSRQELSSFVNGKSDASIELGKQLQQLTGISLEFWMRRQKKYNLYTNLNSSTHT